MNTPSYGNLGDQAIAIAEIALLKEHAKEYAILELEDSWIKSTIKYWTRIINKRDIICITGGGYLGDLWMHEEEFVEQVLKKFPKNKVVIFPQTIYFRDESNVEKSKIAYQNHQGELIFFARDMNSFAFLQSQNFRITKLEYVPDMVLNYEYHTQQMRGDKVLLCFRDDVEQEVSQEIKDGIKEWISNNQLSYFETSTNIQGRVDTSNREQLVKEKLDEFASAKFVITDRLHAMIFAAITGTPCLAIDNVSKKVSGVYEWIKDLKYIIVRNRDSFSFEDLEILRKKANLRYQYSAKKIAKNYEKILEILK